ncbi:MAG: TonB-dependent receptor [Chlorobiaceae bacterium]|nr:TonB-dependent receptor [Chlorobiaceae bacterium]
MKNIYRRPFVRAVLFFIIFSINIFPSPLVTNITGKVIDGETHNGVPFAIVKIINMSLSTQTDAEGNFKFYEITPGDYQMEISQVGYQTNSLNFELKDDAQKSLIIHLYPLPIQVSTVIITGQHTTSKFEDLHEFTSVLKGKDLQRDLGFTLAATLKNETGLSIRSMGPAPARPIIRGLGGDRVLISEDGFITNDLSATSPDHAVSIEPFTVDRIEVLRGPKILLQNSTTIGGIVNIIREEIPLKKVSRVEGNAGMFLETANRGYLGALTTRVPLDPFTFRFEASRRKAANLRTPNKILNNSDLITSNFSLGGSFINDFGVAGVSFRNFESDYGVPGGFVGAHPNGVDIKMTKRAINAKILFNFNSDVLQNLETEFSRTFYHHTEYERKEIIGAEFSMVNYSGRINLNNKQLWIFNEGTLGLSFDTRDFNVGGFVFTPPTKSFSFSSYFYQNFEWDFLSAEFGGRYTHAEFNPRRVRSGAREEFLVKRHFNTFSFSFSLLFDLPSNFFTGTNISRSSRIPTIEELYSEGPHLAAYSYEIGNPKLKDESGTGLEVFVYYKVPSLFFMVTAFRNDLNYYIIPRNNGRINFQTLLPIFETVGVNATVQGVESQMELTLNKNYSVSWSLSYTEGTMNETNSPLPSIPPLKSLFEVKYSSGDFSFGLGSEMTANQNKVDQFEEPTAGYIIFNTFSQYLFTTGNLLHSVSFTIDNILNNEYRNHLSRVKSILPEAERNFRFTYRVYF